MVEESIVFSGTIDDRSLDKSADKVEDRFSEAGQIDVDADTDGLDLGLDGFSDRDTGGDGRDGMSKVDAAMLAVQQKTLKFQKQSAQEDVERNQILNEWGAALMDIRDRIPALAEGGGFAEGGEAPIPIGDGGGGLGAGGDAAAGLASRIPKPIAGVGAASVLPIALAGGIGAGMLAAMHSASARLQTSTTLLGIAADNFFRQPGAALDKHLVRPLAKKVLDVSVDWDELARTKGISFALGAISADAAQTLADQFRPGEAGGTGEGGTGPIGLLDRQIVGFLEGAGFPDVAGHIRDYNKAMDELDVKMAGFGGSLDGMINTVQWAMDNWPGWPNITGLWPGWPSVQAEWMGWPDISPPDWPSTQQIMNQFPELSVGTLRRAILPDAFGGGGNGGNGGNGDTDIDWSPMPDRFRDRIERAARRGPHGNPIGLQSGGRVTETGIAEVHRGELVSDPDRLVSELASAIRGASGGGGGADVSGVERKLDQLNRNVKRLASAMDNQAIQIDGETIARKTSEYRTDTLFDTDSTI